MICARSLLGKAVLSAAFVACSGSICWAQLYGIDGGKVTNSQLQQQIDAHVTCLMRQARQLDDYASDPSRIGEAVSAACESTDMSFKIAEKYGSVSPEMRERLHGLAVTRATNVVLKLRASRAAGSQEN